MIVLNILGYFGRNKQNSYAALKNVFLNSSVYTTKNSTKLYIFEICDFIPPPKKKYAYYLC